MSNSDSTDKRQLYNSIIIDNYIKLIKKKYSYIDIEKLLKDSGMTSYQVEDQGHWFTQQQINLFHEKVYSLTGKKDISREAGAYSVSPDTLGILRRYTLSLLGPVKICEKLEKWSEKFTRSSKYKAKKLGSNIVEIVVTPHDGVHEKPFQCENRIGYFEGISRLFGNKPPQISKTECLSNGDKCCRYIVTFPHSKSDLWITLRWFTALNLTFLCVFLYFLAPQRYDIIQISSFCVMLFLAIGWYSEFLSKRELSKSLNKVRDSSEELIDQINVNYNHALLINETGQILSKQFDTDGILANVVSVMEKRLDYSRALILLANSDKTRLMPCAGFGHTDEQATLLKEWSGFNLDNEGSKGVFVVSFRQKKPFLINDFSNIKDDHSKRSREFAKKMGIKSFLCCPVFFENESLGVLTVDNVKTNRPLLQRDINLLMGVAQQIGIALHSVRLRNQLQHVQKMEAIGTLAKGIAHDFNNVITAIIGYAEIAKHEAKIGRSIHESILKVKQACSRAQELVKQILSFSLEVKQDQKLINLSNVVKESLDLLIVTLPDNISIDVNLKNDCSPILGDETHLHQIIMNLCINAIHAMTDTGGLLEINLKSRQLTIPETEKDPDLIPGEYMQLEVSDTGHGMSPETMERIFEPYFTTKEREKGTGIGLAVVHGIVKKHKGAISVASKQGGGTTFQLLFPNSNIHLKLDKQKAKKLPGGTERILIVEDEKFFADLLKNMLDHLGYNVVILTNSIAALAALKQNPDNYDLIITDYSLAGMNGLELSHKIRELIPALPIILCTGFSDSVSNKIGVDKVVNDYFQKPILKKDLAFKVKKIFNDAEIKKYMF